MKRLTRPTVKVDETAAQYMAATGSIPADLRSMNDRLLDLVINGPTLNGVNKDVLRQLIRQLYAALMPYEDTGLEPDMIEATINGQITLQKALEKYTQAEEQGRIVVLPCPMGSTIYMIVTKHTKGREPFSFIKTTELMESNVFRVCRDYGKTVFLTREEAERTLEGQR